jgi:hypothetical protein
MPALHGNFNGGTLFEKLSAAPKWPEIFQSKYVHISKENARN